jgi:folate-dependent phosphoribosylglycinamide formyltransferase PurN
MRVGILTSDDVRHRFVVNHLRTRFEVTAVCYQNTGYVPADTAAGAVDEQTAAIVRHHFEERRRQELLFFGHNADPLSDSPACAVRQVGPKTLNTADTLALLKKSGVDAVVVYGTGLIRAPLLQAFAGRMINLHLGLSPYYRGTATNFYPLVNEEPEYVGATVHLIDTGIDSGAIIHHARPDIVAQDLPHTVGCKAIQAGVGKIEQALEELAAGQLVSVPQWPVPNGRLYLRQDYHPEQVVRLYRLIEDGLFPKYVARKQRVENAMRLIP